MAVTQYYYHEQEQYGINLAFCGIEDCPEGHVFGPAVRARYLFHYVIDGKGTYQIGEHTYHLHKGQGFLINPSDVTTYSADTHEPWTYMWIAFDGSDAEILMSNCGFSKTNHLYHSHCHDDFTKVFHTLVYNSNNKQDHYFHQISRVYRLFAMMASEAPISPSVQTNSIAKAIEFIHLNYAYDIKVSDISKVVGLERSYLYRRFIEETGVAPKDYLIAYRLKMAKKMLPKREHSLTEIAYTCGFKSSSAFHKHFKKRFNQTPKYYRDMT